MLIKRRRKTRPGTTYITQHAKLSKAMSDCSSLKIILCVTECAQLPTNTSGFFLEESWPQIPLNLIYDKVPLPSPVLEEPRGHYKGQEKDPILIKNEKRNDRLLKNHSIYTKFVSCYPPSMKNWTPQKCRKRRSSPSASSGQHTISLSTKTPAADSQKGELL